MTSGEFCTKATIWLAVSAYVWGTILLLRTRGFAKAPAAARAIWTVGCLCFLAHVGCAFDSYHHWSHAAAYEETARQTKAITGWNSGFGLYLNYAFGAAWLAEAVWWWLSPKTLARRSRAVVAWWHGFYAFMVLNGTIVFGHGPVRWLGVGVVAGMGWVMCRGAKGGTK